ncbi:DUF167 domain-containing protein [bacterium]|nr:MAG: DUF167 domain-containing protein [bacterium]QQR62265.1 MAG: DUF167 domain-containing protein [bacterium]QQR63169.1 MAG: DUF167 domain-containing protein [bacterium]
MKRVFIDLVVVPLSGRQAILKDKNGRIKLFLKSPPEGGKANCELVKYIAGILGLVQQDVSIVNGATSRKKRIAVATPLTLEVVLQLLGIENQIKLL